MDKKTELAIDLGQTIYNNTITALQAKIAKLEAHNETRNIELRASVQQCAQLKEQLAARDAERESWRKLVRDLDRIWNGEGAAKQASICDIVSQVSVDKPALDKLLLLAKDALEYYSNESAAHGTKNTAAKALAAINDSKAVEGLILCDAVTSAWARYPRYTGKAQKPEIVFEQPEGTDWESLHAPRRTEK